MKAFKSDEKCYFILKTLFVLEIFKFLFELFGHVEKAAYYKDRVNFKVHDITTWLTNNCNTHIALNFTK